jgi:VWFA-related protein
MNRNRKLVFLITILAVLLIVVSVPLSQTPFRPADDIDVIKTDTNLVTVNVSVTKKNKPITDLAASDFRISDAGVLVKPEFFEAQGPTSIVFIIDRSTSMRGTKWRNLTSGIKDFLRRQPPDTDYTFIVFSDKPALVSQAIDANEFWKEFSAITPDGETALYDALELGVDQINCLTRHHKAVVFLSDGEDNKSTTSLTAVHNQVLRTHTTIYAVGILIDSSQPDRYRGRDLLKKLAADTGGLSFFPVPDQLDKVLSDINKEIAAQYSFGYYAPTVESGWRNIDIRLLRPVNGYTLRYPQRYLMK